MIFRLITYYVRPFLKWENFIFGIALFIFMGWNSARRILMIENTPVTLWDSVFIALAGPNGYELTLIDFLNWFVIYVVFLFLINRAFWSEIPVMNIAIISRVGSRRLWYTSYVFFVGLLCIAYSTVIILLVAIGSWLVLPNIEISSRLLNRLTLSNAHTLSVEAVIVWTWLLTIQALLTLTTLQWLFSLVLEKPICGFILTVGLCLAGWLSIDSSLLQLLMPATQSMILRHAPFSKTNPNLTFEWSFIYGALLFIGIVFFGFIVVNQIDLTGNDNPQLIN